MASAKARVALFKGGLILLAALAVAGQIAYKLYVPSVPVFEVMGIFSALGLAANGACLALLWRHKDEDVNMSSVWNARETTSRRTSRYSSRQVGSGSPVPDGRTRWSRLAWCAS